MARETLSMRKVSEVLRLSLEQKLSVRQVARSCNLARSTVADYLARAHRANLSWPLPEGMDEARLEGLLFPSPEKGVQQRTPLEFLYIRNELRRKHVTLQLLWRSTAGTRPRDTAIASSANSTAIGLASKRSACGRNTVPARSCSWIMRATRSRSTTVIREP